MNGGLLALAGGGALTRATAQVRATAQDTEAGRRDSSLTTIKPDLGA